MRQQSITEVQPGSHKQDDETVTDGLSDIGSNESNAPQMVVALSSDRVHMALHAEVSVKAAPRFLTVMTDLISASLTSR